MSTGDSVDESEGGQLHSAAQDGALERVAELLDRGAPINAFDELGKTPLHYAAQTGNLELMRLLLRRGADVNAHDETRIGNTPLGEVAGHCSLATATLLIEAGADPTIPGWMQLTALNRAQSRKRGDGPAVCQLLRSVPQRRRGA
jgi:ankyrin repeat protein